LRFAAASRGGARISHHGGASSGGAALGWHQGGEMANNGAAARIIEAKGISMASSNIKRAARASNRRAS